MSPSWLKRYNDTPCTSATNKFVLDGGAMQNDLIEFEILIDI